MSQTTTFTKRDIIGRRYVHCEALIYEVRDDPEGREDFIQVVSVGHTNGSPMFTRDDNIKEITSFLAGFTANEPERTPYRVWLDDQNLSYEPEYDIY